MLAEAEQSASAMTGDFQAWFWRLKASSAARSARTMPGNCYEGRRIAALAARVRLGALGEVTLAAARARPVQAEQVIGSLPPPTRPSGPRWPW